MPNTSDRDVELKFSSPDGRALFPQFCNSLIALEAPRAASFPVLTTRAGPDAGIDGEWDLTGEGNFVPVSVASAGWNVYQFKTVDVIALGEEKAFSGLCRSVRGAIKDLLERQKEARTLGKYVLFTNMRLGPESEAYTASGQVLNQLRTKLRVELLKGSSKRLNVTIIDAGQIAGFVARHPALSKDWFSSSVEIAWTEKQQSELRRNGLDVPLVGRESELADLHASLSSPDVRVIAVSGPNSVGKTRLVIEATKSFSAVTFFVDDVHSLLRDGVSTYATAERPVILVVEDPPVDEAWHLADQAVACERPVKLIMTLPSPRRVPVVRFGDSAAVKLHQIQRLQKDAATQLIASIDPSLDSLLRDWIVQQAGGIPGVLIAAARLGEALHRESGSLQRQLSLSFRQRLEAKLGRDSLPLIQALSLLTYVNVSTDSAELPCLLSLIAPEIQPASARRELIELEALGFLKRQGMYVAVVPPMFAAGLLYDLLRYTPDLPAQLLMRLDLPGRKRLIERLVTLESPAVIEFARFAFGANGPFADEEGFSTNLELLDYLARALPQQTVGFLLRRIDFIWQDVVRQGQAGISLLLAAIGELLDEPATAGTAFSILGVMAAHEAVTSNRTDVAEDFTECYVYWYPRSIPYEAREAILDQMLGSPNPQLRRLALKAVIVATYPPDVLSGRAVSVRRIGSKRAHARRNDTEGFLLRMVRLRIALCADADPAIGISARENLPDIISSLSHHLSVESVLQMVREITEPLFRQNLQLDVVEVRDNVKRLRDFYEQSSNTPGQERWKERWAEAVAALGALIARLETGTFDHRLRMAVGQNSDYEEVMRAQETGGYADMEG